MNICRERELINRFRNMRKDIVFVYWLEKKNATFLSYRNLINKIIFIVYRVKDYYSFYCFLII